jgi:prepilin-type N-terminal cleavage/methylation domain-containing protein
MAGRPRGTFRRAFSLVELLVVIGVIGALIGLVAPAVSRFRAEAHSTVCLSNLRQLFVALETARQQNRDMFPYAAPLPLPEGQLEVVPGLPRRLSGILQPRTDVWFCPADQSDDSQAIGTSYSYVPGAFMLLEPPDLTSSPQANIERVSRLITQRFTDGYLRNLPILTDNDEYHASGGREPWNGVFRDGNARVGKPTDDDIDLPNEVEVDD